ncbi:MAG: DMT family protein [Candidatus Omnitrophica bacterium]|nr:DMT family protein [Candidatus Omnitrophota bacterium]MDD5079818.1 DMT family protein [Candidatus Omnitrophota bacterium]
MARCMIALAEYCSYAPANRIGSCQLSATQLKPSRM